MATQSPFVFVENVLDQFATRFAPPQWVVRETQQRIVLLLNHVLQQEPEALARLKRQQGRVAAVKWRAFSLQLVVTPAGLLDLAPANVRPDLTLALTQTSPMAIFDKTLRGDKPDVRIEGDVQLAAEVNWLVDHVRWDLEEDLSKIVGDVMAHRIGEIGRGLAKALRAFLAQAPAFPLAASAGRKTAP